MRGLPCLQIVKKRGTLLKELAIWRGKNKPAKIACIKVKAGVTADVTETEILCGLKRHYGQRGKL